MEGGGAGAWGLLTNNIFSFQTFLHIKIQRNKAQFSKLDSDFYKKSWNFHAKLLNISLKQAFSHIPIWFYPN